MIIIVVHLSSMHWTMVELKGEVAKVNREKSMVVFVITHYHVNNVQITLRNVDCAVKKEKFCCYFFLSFYPYNLLR